jgi:hypothetical protein
MKTFARQFALLSVSCFCGVAPSRAQMPQPDQSPQTPANAATGSTTPTTPQTAVSLDKEPHHHLVLENGYVHVYRVEVLSSDATLLHRHDVPYLYMSVGKTEFINAVEGKPDATVKVANGQLGYSKGGFAHIIRTEHDTPVYNITIEFLHPQANVRSACAKSPNGLLAGCSAPETAVAAAAALIDAEEKTAKPVSSPGTGNNTPIAQADPDDEKKPKNTAPPDYSPILETDEVEVKFALFTPKDRTSLAAGPAGTLVVIEPLSQFKLNFTDGSSQLLSGGDPFWLQPGTTTTVINTSDQISSSLLIFSFKDAPKPAPAN